MTEVSKRKKKPVPISMLVLAVMTLALLLRVINADNLNNNILDLHARQAIMAIDIMRGHFHFPNGPWLFEYDESGLAWLMVPWILIFGHKWIVFRMFGAVLTSIVPGAITWTAIHFWNRRTGLAAGIFIATLPPQMIWDRNLVMSALAVSTIAWFLSLHLVWWRSKERFIKFLFAGLVIGLSSYVVHYSVMFLPVIVLFIIQDGFRSKRTWSRTIFASGSVISGWFIAALPILIHKFNHPEYLKWRKRHLISFSGDLSSIVREYFINLWSQFREIFFGGGKFIFLHDGMRVLSPVFSVLILLGLFFLIRKERHKLIIVFALPVSLFLMMGFTKTENWRGVFNIHYLPFFSIAAALGVRQIGSWLTSWVSMKRTRSIVTIFVMILTMFHLWQFFYGPCRIYPRPDFLTRLQEDMIGAREIPYLFSSRINETLHYHIPFWFVTRVDHYKVSIFSWDDEHWLTEPDLKPVEFVSDPDAQTGFVIRKQDLEEFKLKMGSARIFSEEELSNSGLLLLVSKVKIPDLLKRTWTDTLVPPMIDVKAATD